MAVCHKAARPLARCMQTSQPPCFSARSIRQFTTTSRRDGEVATVPETEPIVYDPATVTSRKGEKALMKSGVMPIGSRRRRAALKSSGNLPFEQLPYQCFQEALKIFRTDREEKLKQIQTERLRISNLEAQDASNVKGGEVQKQRRLVSMRSHLEYLKIQADINDPLIKKRFEDGEGDMNKPIYRYMAEKQWRKYQQLLIAQRIDQFNIVPDVLPHFEPTADVRLAFKQRSVQHGEYVDSRVSEVPLRLKVQVFDKGERLVSIVVIDSDVPVSEEDNFTSRCHFLATNIPLSPTITSIPISQLPKESIALPWMPPFAQKGSPYHRYSVFVLQQQPGETLDAAQLKEAVQRDGFRLRSFKDKYKLDPIGMSIFRSTWDEGTAGVMQRAGIEGADIEFKRKRVEALKPKQKARGWEARHSSAKYRQLWR
ncbi:putative 54S ribosomal protein L35, mitochondrial [Venustampulla echinocandica]|uniref:Large ribosomal subunit protein mL38 n=1 Tax=Venustampulla echinocandica TaxID=2656787 RepID=A0A370TV83_9HELO|nr:putative 54S ribosomal protein L35, mitochondrial [Venustampulla echinocandica]RDL39443.1 putative 54S ribosomal protein L35, mitochondrial [Venustampulla echinocandica]